MPPFLAELAASLDNLGDAQLTPDTRFRDQPWWDSMAVLTVLAVYDACYDRQLTATDLKACHTLADIMALANQ
jgi:acyl carrier protein